MSEQIIFDSDYRGYVFCGAAQGRFEIDVPDDPQMPDGKTHKEMRDYFNIYCVTPVSDFRSADYSAFGFKAEKFKCISADAWSNVQIGDRVRLLFDDKKRVALVINENT